MTAHGVGLTCSQCQTRYRWRSLPRLSRDPADLAWAHKYGHPVTTDHDPPLIWREEQSCDCSFASRLKSLSDDLLELCAQKPARDDPDFCLIARHEISRRRYTRRPS